MSQACRVACFVHYTRHKPSLNLITPLATVLQSIEGLTAELDDLRRQPSPLAAAQAAKQEVLSDQRKFQEVIAGNQVWGQVTVL